MPMPPPTASWSRASRCRRRRAAPTISSGRKAATSRWRRRRECGLPPAVPAAAPKAEASKAALSKPAKAGKAVEAQKPIDLKPVEATRGRRVCRPGRRAARRASVDTKPRPQAQRRAPPADVPARRPARLAPLTRRSPRQRRRSHQELVDGARSLAAFADRPDHQRLAAAHVAGGEHLVSEVW